MKAFGDLLIWLKQTAGTLHASRWRMAAAMRRAY
jgi:hypothetical protein